MRFFTIVVLALLAPLVAGCTSNLQELRDISPAANDFSSSLAAEYLEYSESETELGRNEKADYFAKKGLAAAKGEKVEPDVIEPNKGANPSLLTARKQLIAALTDNVKRVAPQKAARAQLLFDCWNEQESLKLPAAQATCAEEFSRAFDNVQAVADSFIYGADSARTIIFAAGSAELSAEAQETIAEIAKHMTKRKEKHKNYALILNPHHNPSDTETEFGKLAQARVAATTEALSAAGVPKEYIRSIKSGGKTMVYLSNDELMQNSDELDISIVSPHNFKTSKFKNKK